jgi:HSP20 family protein
MSLVRFYPLADIDTLHRQMNRLFDELTTWDNPNATVLKPAVELLDNEDNLTLRVLLPGIDKKDLDISVTRDVVKIAGEYRPNPVTKDKGYYISEFNYGKFERIINLPVQIQNDKVTADYSDGILTLTLPKKEEVKNKVFKVNLVGEDQDTIEAETNQ